MIPLINEKINLRGQLRASYSGWTGKVPFSYRAILRIASEVTDISNSDERNPFNPEKRISRNNQYRKIIDRATVIFLKLDYFQKKKQQLLRDFSRKF